MPDLPVLPELQLEQAPSGMVESLRGHMQDDDIAAFVNNAVACQNAVAREFRKKVPLPIVAPPVTSFTHDHALLLWNKGDMLGWLGQFEREHRLEAVAACYGRVDVPLLSAMFMDAWTDSDHHLWRQPGLVRALMGVVDPDAAMSEKEKSFLAELPDPVMVYRGCHEYNIRGFSWTTDLDVAQFFTRYRPPRDVDMAVIGGPVAKRFVFMACQERDESEIVVRVPQRVRFRRIEGQTASSPKATATMPHAGTGMSDRFV